MQLLARFRRGTGSTALALVTATALTAAWATPASAAKPKKAKQSQKEPEPAPEPASDEEVAAAAAALGDLSGDGLEVSVEGEDAAQQGEAELSGAELDAAARAAFDSGDYATAAESWTLALEVTPESKSTHMARAVMLENAVIARRQVYAETQDRDALFAAQDALHNYMRECKRAYDLRCNSHPETDDARALLADVRGAIDASEDAVKRRAPPEHLTAIGGRPLDVTKRHEPVPPWAIVATIGGAAVATGGAYLLYWARTDPRFQTTDEGTAIARFAEDDTTGDTGTDTDTDSGTSTTGTLSGVTLTDEAKGKLYTGLGVTGIAVGVGFIVLGALRVAKTRRINRRENLAVSPAFGPGGGGVMVQGRF